LRVLRVEVSVLTVYITNQFQTTLAHWGRGVKSVSKGDCEWQGGKLFKTFVPITSKNLASGDGTTMGQQRQGVAYILVFIASGANLESKFV
jgi:hypothetical protein